MHHIFWAILILFLVAALLRMDWIYYLVYVVGGVWVFSHWWIRRILSRLRVERRLPRYAFANEHLTAQVVVQNPVWLPLPWLQVQEAVPLELKNQAEYRTVFTIGGHSVLEHSYPLYCRRRGYYTVGPLTLRTSDLFGFVEARWEEQKAANLIVYPQIVPLSKLGLPSRSPFGGLATRQQMLEDPARMSGVRVYMNGDSLRRIHWKATAHEDTLLVKKFQPSKEVPVAILLDLDREAYPIRSRVGSSEWAISIAASIANAIIGQRQPVGLITNGSDPLAGKAGANITLHGGQEHLTTILSLLARIQMHTTESNLAAWMPAQVASLPWGTTLVVVTPQLDEPALWVLHSVSRRGSNVVVLVCARQRDFRSIQGYGRQLGVDVHSTIWDRDLVEMAEA
ncbi:MAG: DUF58 domain-containing protein [Caldilineaceae bacterium]|nr:DUF58 domain-containing protein [Caldilineaceae bacterium]